MLLTELINSPSLFLFWVVAILASLTVHEYMHAWTANYLGDDTAKHMGRLTLNPIAHLDPIGSVMILFFGFGWAKPVMVNPNRFRNPKVGDALTSLSGPLANLFLAIVFAFVYRLLPGQKETFTLFVFMMILLNVRLMIFNLLPVPPLDGSHLLGLLIKDPGKLARIESYGIILLIPLIFLASYIIEPISNFMIKILIG